MPKKRIVKITRKVSGRTIVDESRRHHADQGGRKPLTEFPLVPVGCVIPMETMEKLKEKSDLFISPSTLKPYGLTATTRIYCQIMVEKIDNYFEGDYLKYLSNRAAGVAGRTGLAEDTHKLALLIPKPIIDRVNEKVRELQNSLIGTSTILRFLIERGIEKVKIEKLYAHMPDKHKDLMIINHYTIESLQAQYRSARKKK